MALLHSEQLPTGWEAVDFQLPNTDEVIVSLKNFTGKKGLLVIFTCNHCPYAKASWPLIVDLAGKFKNEIGFVAINPNDKKAYPEDSFEEMKKKKTEWNIPFDYVRDESQKIAKAYKAQCTPDPYLFKNDNGVFKLFYHGRVNDNWQNPSQVKEKNLEDAINALFSGKEASSNQPPSIGCSIKWKS